MTTVNQRIRQVAGAVAVAATCGALLIVASGQAFAAPAPHALRTSLSKPAPVAPGSTGTITYTVKNQSAAATEGVLINISLPKYVTINPDAHCQKTGTNPEGGDLISCNMSDNLGKLAPGQTNTDHHQFAVAKEAPHHAMLGQLTTLAVPLKNGTTPTEDWHDFSGGNASTTVIVTS